MRQVKITRFNAAVRDWSDRQYTEVQKRKHERSETSHGQLVQTARHTSPTTTKSAQMWKDSPPKEKQDIVIYRKENKILVDPSKAKRTFGKLQRCFYESISTCSNNSLNKS
jgi:carboxylesterase type B